MIDNMKTTKSLFTVFILASIYGCTTVAIAPPSETTITAAPFKITVPKTLNTNSDLLLKGVSLQPFENHWGTSPVRNFFSVNFENTIQDSELTTKACQGESHDSGSKYKSCISFDSRLAVTEGKDVYNITITPYRTRSAQGRNALYFPLSMPNADINTWYKWI